MADVLSYSSTGGWQQQNIAAIGAVALAANSGLDLTANELSIPAATAGNGVALTAGVLSVSLPGMGAKVAISTAGNGVLTAAGIVGGLIMRTGPTGAYADATDTATAILALIDSPAVNQSWEFTVVNGVAFADTVSGGAGVTMAGVVNITASLVRRYRATITNIVTPAVLITGIGEMTA